jgi:hypothetical protein
LGIRVFSKQCPKSLVFLKACKKTPPHLTFPHWEWKTSSSQYYILSFNLLFFSKIVITTTDPGGLVIIVTLT